MSLRPWRDRVHDILDAIAQIQQYTSDMDAAAFLADPKTVDAVIYRLMIIGEAARHVSPAIKKLAPTVPWQLMIGLRNHAAHGYWGIMARIVWDTVTRDLPPLVIPLRDLLARSDDATK